MEQKIDLYQSSDLELIFEDLDDSDFVLPKPFLFEQKKHLHILPFSHVPMSLDMTPRQYLMGIEDEELGKKPVKDILSSAILELEQDKSRTFAFSNIDMLKNWWEMQPVTKKESVKDLIVNK